MPKLKQNPQISDFQKYVKDMKVERGFNQTDLNFECLLLNEEIGELCKAVRKYQGKRLDPNSRVAGVAEELADVLIYICSIANMAEVDLEQAFRDKEVINSQRKWV